LATVDDRNFLAATRFQETRDSLRDALRRADVTVEINGRTTTLTSGNSQLPVLVFTVRPGQRS
jgi:hypothetical protein